MLCNGKLEYIILTILLVLTELLASVNIERRIYYNRHEVCTLSYVLSHSLVISLWRSGMRCQYSPINKANLLMQKMNYWSSTFRHATCLNDMKNKNTTSSYFNCGLKHNGSNDVRFFNRLCIKLIIEWCRDMNIWWLLAQKKKECMIYIIQWSCHMQRVVWYKVCRRFQCSYWFEVDK